MQVIPLAAESLGTRSMATYVKTRTVGVLIDPGVDLSPKRFGLPPHELELAKMNEAWVLIESQADASDVVLLSHFHHDHFSPEHFAVFRGKKAYLKHPRSHINRNQKTRALDLLARLKGVSDVVTYADGRRFSLDGVSLSFSKAVPHGIDYARGFVVQVCIEDDRRFLHTSDVQGLPLDEHMEFVLESDPHILYVDGPMAFMPGEGYDSKYFHAVNTNLSEVIRETGVETVIIDHHMTRDLEYEQHISGARRVAEEHGVRIVTAAEFLGRKPELLEARRKELYEGSVTNGG